MAKRKKRNKARLPANLAMVCGAELIDGLIPDPSIASAQPGIVARIGRWLGPPPLILAKGEAFRDATRHHWWVLVKECAKSLHKLPLAALIVFILDRLSGVWWVTVIALIIALANAIEYAYRILAWRAKLVIVTSKKFVFTQGVLRRGLVSKPFSKVKGINVNQSVVGRCLGFGHLELTLGDDDSVRIVRYVSRPWDIYAAAAGEGR